MQPDSDAVRPVALTVPPTDATMAARQLASEFSDANVMVVNSLHLISTSAMVAECRHDGVASADHTSHPQVVGTRPLTGTGEPSNEPTTVSQLSRQRYYGAGAGRAERFSPEWWAKNVEPEPNSGCHLWTGNTNHDGYGVVSVARSEGRGRTSTTAHRMAYESAFGPFDRALKVCHRCDTPSCVNPDHLYLGTQKDNLADMRLKGRANDFTVRHSWTGERRGAA